MPIKSGEYISPTLPGLGVMQIYDLGNGDFQLKGEKLDKLKHKDVILNDIAKAKTEKEKSELNDNLKRLLNTDENTRNNLIFKTVDFGKGWFAIQIVDVISYGFKTPDGSFEKNDLIIGNSDKDNIIIMKSQKCFSYDASNKSDNDLADKYGIIFYRIDKDVHIKSIKSYFDFYNFMVQCINEKQLEGFAGITRLK